VARRGANLPVESDESTETLMTEDRTTYDPFAPPAATVSLSEAGTPETKPVNTDDLDDMRKADLVELADGLGVDSDGTKADIIARLRAL
jgi:hypothetical protein